MKKVIRGFFISSAVLILVGMAFILGAASMGVSWWSIGHNGVFSAVNRINWINVNGNATHYKEVRKDFSNKDVESVFIDVASGSLIIEKSSDKDLHIVVESYYGQETRINVNDELLTIKNNTHASDLKITMYLPSEKEFESFDIRFGAGVVKIYSDITTDFLNTDVGAGSFRCDGKIFSEKATVKVGAGEIELSSLRCENIILDCAVGSIAVKVDGEKSDYSYEIDCAIGSVRIGDEKFGGLGQSLIRGNSEKEIKANCAVGEIKVDFTEKEYE